MAARGQKIGRPIAWAAAGLASVGSGGCMDEIRGPRVLTDDPVVMGIAASVVEDGPYAGGIASMPPDRPRAELLPLDTVELDALVANVDGLVALDDAAWVLCGAPCLSSIEAQALRYGELLPCDARSTQESHACLAGRGARPRLTMPDIAPSERFALHDDPVFPRVALVVATPDGPSTDECLAQLLAGEAYDLWGCGIGVRDLPYGPLWKAGELLVDNGYPLGPGFGDLAQFGDFTLPPTLGRLLPPNAAAQVEQVRVLESWTSDAGSLERVEARGIDEPIDVTAGAGVIVEPVISPRDQQISLQQVGPEEWLGRTDRFYFNAWTDHPGVGYLWNVSFPDRFWFTAPRDAGLARFYVVVTDDRSALSWFTLDFRVIER